MANRRGADKAVVNFAKGLVERGHDAVLLEKKDFPRILNEQWDVIIATGSNEAMDLDSAGYFERFDRAKVILQLHLEPKGFFKWKHPCRNARIRKAFNKVDIAQVLCKEYEGLFRKIAPHPKVVAIGNFTDVNFVQDRTCSQGCRSEIMIYPAAFQRVKNQELLIKAFARLAKRFPEWRVHLLGDDTTRYAKRCKNLVARMGLGERIVFKGFVKDLAGEYANAAFVAFPSTLEGFPLSLLEAARYGLCVVAHTGLLSAHSIIVDGKTGLLTAPTVKAYADALRRLMADKELRSQMGERAREFCAEHYSREKILDRWEALLRELESRA